jgi:hypothetical protein
MFDLTRPFPVGYRWRQGCGPCHRSERIDVARHPVRTLRRRNVSVKGQIGLVANHPQAAEVTREAGRTHVLLPRSLFAYDIPRRFLRRASVARPTFVVRPCEPLRRMTR